MEESVKKISMIFPFFIPFLSWFPPSGSPFSSNIIEKTAKSLLAKRILKEIAKFPIE